MPWMQRTKPKFLEWLTSPKQQKATTTINTITNAQRLLYAVVFVRRDRRAQTERMEKLKCIKELVCSLFSLYSKKNNISYEVRKQCTDWDSIRKFTITAVPIDFNVCTTFVFVFVRFFLTHHHGLHLLLCNRSNDAFIRSGRNNNVSTAATAASSTSLHACSFFSLNLCRKQKP